METTITQRPRNVAVKQSIAILYGDWGTSKAYVLGLAFAIAGYSSFWLIFAMGILIALVGINYITICKFRPTGGGVYGSARKKSEILALVAAFFLIADYLITASLSALASFEYLGVTYPSVWAIGIITVIGFINYFGPKHSGNIAFIISIPTVMMVILLSLLATPYLNSAVKSIHPLEGGIWINWTHFVGMIVALSGIESIANTTVLMPLDVDSTPDHPSVHQTSKKAILWVMIEVCFFTVFLGLVMHALPGLYVIDGQVHAPNQTDIRDFMLRYMGEYFATQHWGPDIGFLFGSAIAITFAALLFSAVNTAIVTLVSLLFVMSRDGEVPVTFQKLNRFGVPVYSLLVAMIAPIVVLIFVNDMAHLADLYAVGFVGAVATNLGTNAFDETIPMTKKERRLMKMTFILMTAIELTLLIVKPKARLFVVYMLTAGFILRGFVQERRQKQWAAKRVKLKHASLYQDDTRVPLHYGAILCAVSTIGKTLNFALQEAKHYEQPLYILFVRNQKVIMEEDRSRIWLDDEDACRIFDYAKESSHEMTIKFLYAVSDSPANTIVQMAKQLQVSRVILGRPRQGLVLQMLRGNIAQEVAEILPSSIDLLVIS
jgi:amino acid transporter/nucleotide-binding universal stress UspA family protein